MVREILNEEQGYFETDFGNSVRVWKIGLVKTTLLINWWLFSNQTFQSIIPLHSTNFVLINDTIVWTNLIKKFILIFPPKLNLKPDSKTAKSL